MSSIQIFGIVVHHSVCPSINGKGYDFFITRSGSVIPAKEQTDPLFIHVCIEGDFSERRPLPLETKEQLFILSKLIVKLANRFGFDYDDIFPHTDMCPGAGFPWSELVISPKDEYH